MVSGVPQGSVLGPLYFLIFINDISTSIPPGIRCMLFADDVKIFAALNGRSNEAKLLLQESLDNVMSWASDWQLNISYTKSFCIRFGREDIDGYSLGHHHLTAKDACSDLGVLFTRNVRFKDHCVSIACKPLRIINILFRSFTVGNCNAIVRAYCVYVRPILEYCSPVWSPVYVTDIDLIERVQRYFTRRLYHRLSYEPSSYLNRLKRLGLDPLELRRLRLDLLTCYKIVHCEIALAFADFFEWSPGINRTRGHTLRLRASRANSNVLSHFFAHRVVPVWNSLPSSIGNAPLVTAQNFIAFKKRLRYVDLSAHLRYHRRL